MVPNGKECTRESLVELILKHSLALERALVGPGQSHTPARHAKAFSFDQLHANCQGRVTQDIVCKTRNASVPHEQFNTRIHHESPPRKPRSADQRRSPPLGVNFRRGFAKFTPIRKGAEYSLSPKENPRLGALSGLTRKYNEIDLKKKGT